MKIKKIMATIALLSFTWSILPAQTYEDAARITQEADDLQNQGQYQQSYDKSQEASLSIDKAQMALFYRLMNARINKTKNDANNAITEINQMGAATDDQFKAQYEEAVKYFEEGNANIGSIPGPDTVAQTDEEFNTASNTFNTVLEYYNNALSSANSVKEGYLGRERDTASKAIADARGKYNAALGKSIKAGDNNDKTVSGALTKADEALKADNFASVQQNVAAALAGITKAEADAKAAADMLCVPTRLSGFFSTAIAAGWKWMIAGIGTSAFTTLVGAVFIFVFIYNAFKFALMGLGVIMDLFLSVIMLPFTAISETINKTSYKGIAGDIFNGFLGLFKPESLSNQIKRFINAAVYFVSLSIVIAVCGALLSGTVDANLAAEVPTLDNVGFILTLLTGLLVAYLADKAEKIAKDIGGEINYDFGKKFGEDVKTLSKKIYGKGKEIYKLLKEDE